MNLVFAFCAICSSVMCQLTPDLDSVAELNSETFGTFTACERPVVVDFYTSACAPCMIMEKRIETWSETPTFQNRIRFGKVNCVQERALAKRYQIEAFPTLGVFQRGRMTRKLIGVQSFETIREATACEEVKRNGF